MFKTAFASALIAATGVAQLDDEIAWTPAARFNAGSPAFASVTNFKGGDDFILFSTFNAFRPGHIKMVRGVKDAVINGTVDQLSPTKLNTGDLQWPNDVRVVPHDVFNTNAIHIPDGFLVPGHANGGVYVVEVGASNETRVKRTVTLTTNTDGYFYHMGQWIDMNGDGLVDFVTAKSNAKNGGGRLVWLEHPVGGLDVENWTEHVITEGPDVGIKIVDFPEYPNEIVVFAAEFFNQALSVQRVSTVDGSLVARGIIDDTEILDAYSVDYVDLNSDGQYQLLVNNHEKKQDTNGIWTYSVPADIINGHYEKNTVATGFKNVFSITVPGMSPGFPYAVWPKTASEGTERAHIIVAGDGDYAFHAYHPNGDASIFNYGETLKIDYQGTIGSLAWSDLDEDGWLEVWVPNYDGGYIEMIKTSPASNAATYIQ